MKDISIDVLQTLCQSKRILWREHALQRMNERNILKEDVRHCIEYGIIIEYYPEDYPVPSCLILGTDQNGKEMHVVCSAFENMACVITAYYPDRDKWQDDFKTREEAE